jgi:hypothetical protein
MANALKQDLHGKVVIVKAEVLKPEFRGDRRFLCESGFGCFPHTAGAKVFGKWLVDDSDSYIDGHDIERLAEDTNAKTEGEHAPDPG